MEKVSMLPTVHNPASASPLRSLELMMQEALEKVSRLQSEVAELKSLAASLRGVNGSFETVSSAGHQHSLKRRQPDPDFDWEAWARETKARIRGDSVGSEASTC